MIITSSAIKDGIIDKKYGKYGEHFNENGWTYTRTIHFKSSI